MQRAGVVLFALGAMTSSVHASPAAEKLFEDGRRAFKEGKLDEACEAFRRSQELEARVGTLLNLGDCEEKRGKTATAWVAFVDATSLAKRKNDPRAAEAEKRAQALADKLPHLRMIVIDPTPGLVVKRHDQEVAPAELKVEVPIDPVTYKFDAWAAGLA